MSRTIDTSRYSRYHRRQNRWYSILAVFAAVVVFVTTYMLILPAITKTSQNYCGMEGHRHTEECYSVENLLICQDESEEHQHTEECYAEQSTLICNLEEHTHSLDCFSNPEADVENEEVWSQSVRSAVLSGMKGEDLARVAETQLGYSESEQNYRVQEDGESIKGYTRYGAWYGEEYQYEDWDAMFVSFCLHYAGIHSDCVPYKGTASEFREAFLNEGLYTDDPAYTPKSGDLVFLTKEEGSTGHEDAEVSSDLAGDGYTIGIVTSVSEEELTVVLGDCGDQVASVVYASDSSRLIGFGSLPENSETISEETVFHVRDPESAETAGYISVIEPTFEYTAKCGDVKVKVGGSSDVLPVRPDQVVLNVRELTDQEAELVKAQMNEVSELHESGDSPESKGEIDRLFDISLRTGEEEIEPTGSVTISISGIDSVNCREVEFYHVNEDTMEKEVLNTFVEESGSLTAETDHFSIYGVTNGPREGNAVATAADFANLANGGTYRLTADITVNSSVEISKDTTLDLNGHTLTASGQILKIVSGGTLTIKDRKEIAETVEVVSTDHAYNNLAEYNSQKKTLTYYITVPEVQNASTGATVEHVEKHTVTAAGLITTTSSCAATPIYMAGGTLNLESGMIAGSKCRAVYANNQGATINLNGGYICGNNTEKVNTQKGGAVYLAGNGTINLTGTVIAGNHAPVQGGGIYVGNGSTLNISRYGVISGNICNTNGDGDRNGSWEATLFGGGGVYAEGTTINMSGGYVTNNRSTTTYYFDGGGGFLLKGGVLNITSNDARITGNDSLSGGGAVKTTRNTNTEVRMTGGFVSSNHADGAEAGGMNFDNNGVGYITAGYITNNDLEKLEQDGVIEHWGGGGLFCSDGAQLYLENVLITDNTAGGYGGGVAGCSTGRVNICVEDGGAIYDNTAQGEHLSGSASAKHDDTNYAKENVVFKQNGYTDYYCALSSYVDGGMLGGGTSNWTGSADGTAITSTSRYDVLTATYIMGLTAHPGDADKSNAQAEAKLYITGNESYTHGGGVLANGYLLIGNTDEILVPARIELSGVKALLKPDQTSDKLTANQFDFQLKDQNGNVVALGTNDASGKITFDRRLPFDREGTFTYFLTEVGGGEVIDGVMYDSAVYRMTVDAKKSVMSEITDAQGRTVTRNRIEVTNVKIERADSETGTYKTVYNKDPGDSDVHAIELPVTSGGSETTFTNTELNKMDYTVKKVWSDGELQKPEITVKLYRNDQIFDTKTLSSANGWSYTWTGLDTKDSAGNTYSYSVREDRVTGYLASYSYSSNGSGEQGDSYWVPVGTDENFENGTQYVFLSSNRSTVLSIASNRTNTALGKQDLKTVTASRNTGSRTINGKSYTNWYAENAFSEESIFVAQSDSRITASGGVVLKSYLYNSWLSDEHAPRIKTTSGKTYAGAEKITNGRLKFQQGYLASGSNNNEYYYAMFDPSASNDEKAITADSSYQRDSAVRVYKKVTEVSESSASTTCTITNTPVTDIPFRLNIRKVNAENTQMALKDAKFKLIDSNGSPIRFVIDETDGYYKPDATGSEELLVSNANGYIRVKELPGGTYTLKEIYAPTGYGLAADQTIVLDETTDGTTFDLTVMDPVKIFELPKTGGSGMDRLTFGGLLLMAGSAVIYLFRFRYRKRKERRFD